MKELVLCMLLSSIPQLCCSHAEPALSSSPARRLLPTAEVSTLTPVLEQDARECGISAPQGSVVWVPARVTKSPLGSWIKDTPARSHHTMSSPPSGTAPSMQQLSTLGGHESTTEAPGWGLRPTERQASPVGTSWLLGLDKHDVPVVVGASASLALILLSMGIYFLWQKTEHTKGSSTASPKPSSGRSWRRNYLEVDRAYENRAFEVECAIDTLSLDETPAPRSLEGPGPTAPTGETQDRPEDAQALVQSETSPQGHCPSPGGATSAAAAEEPRGRRPDVGTAASPAPPHICTTLHLYRPETSECLPPREQAGAVLAVTIDICLCPAEVCSAAGTASNASEPPLPEAASQPPAASLDPRSRSYLRPEQHRPASDG